MDTKNIGTSKNSQEIIGGLQTNFSTPLLDDNTERNQLSVGSIQNSSIDSSHSNTDQTKAPARNESAEVLGSYKSKSVEMSGDDIKSSSSKVDFTELFEDSQVLNKKNISKSVSFRIDSPEVSESIDDISKPSDHSYTSTASETQILQHYTYASNTNTLKTNNSSSRKSISMLENIAEVDESASDMDETPGYYGWDGYEARFQENIADSDSWNSIPGCIPPWAKSVRKGYGLSPITSLDEDQVSESKRAMNEKIENLMKKHKDLMLLKRVESKKQLIVEPNKDPNELDAVKMRVKSTRYYLTPLDLGKVKTDEQFDEQEKVSLPSLTDRSSLSMTKKTTKSQARRDISQVLNSLQKTVSKKKGSTKEYNEFKIKKEQDKCPKITLSDIREFVNMTPDERKLHEIIRIEKVPSVKDLRDREKEASKYIINVPKSSINDQPTVNVIKIKEKRKLRVDSIENIEEKVTELHYNQGNTRRHLNRGNEYIYRDRCDSEQMQHIKKTTKSPTETKTLEVTTKQTPLLTPLVQEDDKKTEKVLLLQYDKKSKGDKQTTHLLGIKEPCTNDPGEMYLYGSETEGKKVKENITRAQEIPPSLKDKVHLIFEELRGLKLNQNKLGDFSSTEVQARPSVDFKSTQRPSNFTKSTEVAMVEAKPEVKSAAVQVRQSLILTGQSVDSFKLVAPHSTPTSDFFVTKEEMKSSFDQDLLLEKLEESAGNDLLIKDSFTDEYIKKEKEIEQQSVKDEVETTSEMENKSEELFDETVLKEEIEEGETNLDHKIEDDQSAVVEEKLSDPDFEVVKLHIQDEDVKESKEQKEIFSSSSKEFFEEPTKDTDKENELLSKIPSKALSKISWKKSVTLSPDDIESMKESILSKVTTVSDKSKKVKLSKDESTESIYKSNFLDIDEDIRSYEIDPKQGTDFLRKSSSKFLHKKEDLRKRMNWTDDTIFLENNTCPQLIRGLAETAVRQPADPIAFLAHWIYKDCENRERREQEEVWHEHLELTRAMADVAATRHNNEQRKTFNAKKYPVNIVLVDNKEEDNVNENKDESENLQNFSENKMQTNEIIQEG